MFAYSTVAATPPTENLSALIGLHGGKPLKSLTTLSHVALVNGDRIPGTITELNDETLMLDTPYAGSLRIPRNQVAMLAPSPLGGRIHYHGPFVEDEWKLAIAAYPDGMPHVKPGAGDND